MALFDQFTPAPRNRLLAALPPEDLARLRPRLERVELPVRHTLYAADEPITAVHFPETGWVSMLATLESGDAAEVGLIGREGMVGLPLLLGADRAPFEAMTQAGGTVLRLDAAAFREELGGPVRPADAAAALRHGLQRAGLADRGLQRAPPRRGSARALAADGARPGRGGRVPDDA
jgi:CRP-like cAMP-binding protein